MAVFLTVLVSCLHMGSTRASNCEHHMWGPATFHARSSCRRDI